MSGTESLKTIQRSPKPNSAFFVTDGVETEAEVDEHLPHFDLSAEELFSRAVEVFGAQKNTQTTNRDESVKRASFVCTTPLLRFKDDVELEVVSTGEGRAGIILFSRSRVGWAQSTTKTKIKHKI